MSASAAETRTPVVPTPDAALPEPASCPVCGGAVEAGDGSLLLGELLDCLECASELEVTALAPLVLTEAPMAAEDWGE